MDYRPLLQLNKTAPASTNPTIPVSGGTGIQGVILTHQLRGLRWPVHSIAHHAASPEFAITSFSRCTNTVEGFCYLQYGYLQNHK
jgi:hypothetical protein